MFDGKGFERSYLIKITAGTLLGGLAVWLSVRGVSLSRLKDVLEQADPWLMMIGVGVVLLNVAVLGVRWWVMLLDPWDRDLFFNLLGGVYLGQMVNILIPARLGELARVYYAADRTQYSKSRLLGSLVLEKMIDVIIFGLALLLLISAVTLPGWVFKPGRSFLFLAGASLIAVLILVIWGRAVLRWVKPLIYSLPAGWGKRLAGMLDQGLSGLDSMREGKRQLIIWGFAGLSLLMSTTTNWLILRALEIRLPMTAALFVLIVIQIGSAPPTSPGRLGVFHFLGVLALSAYSIEKEIALAYSVLLYLVVLMPKVVIGIGILIFSRWKLPELHWKLTQQD